MSLSSCFGFGRGLRRVAVSRGRRRGACGGARGVERLEDRRLLSVAANVNTDADSDGLVQNETTLAVNPTNPLNMIGSANEYQVDPRGNFDRQKGVLFTTLHPRARVTVDGGQTWATYEIPFPGYGFAGDPSVSFDAKGTAYFSAVASALSQQTRSRTSVDLITSHSGDGGRTWTNPVRVASATGGTTPNAPQSTNDKPFVTAWGNGNAVVTWTQFNAGQKGALTSVPALASVTHDGGDTWTSPVRISGAVPSGFFAVPTVAADGSGIYVGFMTLNAETGAGGTRDRYYVVELDPRTGQPRRAPREVALMYNSSTDHPANVEGRPTYQDSQLRSPYDGGNTTADPVNPNHLAVIWSDMRNNPYPDAKVPSADPYKVVTNSDVVVSQSFDRGLNWSAPKAITVRNDQFMPFADYDATGHLQIGYFDRSYDAANHKYGYTLASERTPGKLDFTFQQVTTALSDPTRDNVWFGATVNPDFPNAATFMGDYSAVAVTPYGVGALWTDMRLPMPIFGGSGENVFFALVTTPSTAMATFSTMPIAGRRDSSILREATTLLA